MTTVASRDKLWRVIYDQRGSQSVKQRCLSMNHESIAFFEGFKSIAFVAYIDVPILMRDTTTSRLFRLFQKLVPFRACDSPTQFLARVIFHVHMLFPMAVNGGRSCTHPENTIYYSTPRLKLILPVDCVFVNCFLNDDPTLERFSRFFSIWKLKIISAWEIITFSWQIIFSFNPLTM